MKACWWIRHLILRQVTAESPLSSRVRQHTRHCPDCQSYLDAQLAMTRRLRLEAPAFPMPPAPQLERRILAALAGANRAASPRPRALSPVWAYACAALVAAGLGWWGAQRLSQPSAAEAEQMVEAVHGMWRTVMEPGPTPDPRSGGERLADWSRALEQPLETEWRLVKHDARSALRGLADHFLPSQYQQALDRLPPPD